MSDDGARLSLVRVPAASGLAPELPGLSVEACEVLQRHEDTTGDYTGERIRARNPPLYRVACELIARGMTLQEVAQVTALSRNTVRAIARAEADGIDQRKQRLARGFLDLAEVAAGSALARIESGKEQVSLHHLMIAAGIAADKGLIAAGQATARVEHVQDVPERDELLRMLANQAKPADVLDTGTGARAGAQRGGKAGTIEAPSDRDQAGQP